MHFGTMCTRQDHAVTGVLYDMRSVYEGLSQLSDMRKAREKLSRLETVLMIIVMAKLRGSWIDRIADPASEDSLAYIIDMNNVLAISLGSS